MRGRVPNSPMGIMSQETSFTGKAEPMVTTQEVLARNYTFIAKADLEDGGWVIVYPDLPGVMTQADTYGEIGEMAEDALRTWAEAQIEDGKLIPEPTDIDIPEWDWSVLERDLVSTREVAATLGVTSRRVLALAKSRDVGTRIGRSVMFRRSDVAKLYPGKVGRPRETSAIERP